MPILQQRRGSPKKNNLGPWESALHSGCKENETRPRRPVHLSARPPAHQPVQCPQRKHRCVPAWTSWGVGSSWLCSLAPSNHPDT